MKNAVKILFLLIPLVFVAQKSTSKSFTNSVQLNDSKENVWNAITDFSTFSLWDNNVVDVKCPVLAKNQMCKVIVGNGKIFDVEIVELIEGETYTIRYKLSSGNVYIKRSIQSNNGLTLTETVWYKGISKKTFEKYKGVAYGDIMNARMLDFKKYVEEDLADRR